MVQDKSYTYNGRFACDNCALQIVFFYGRQVESHIWSIKWRHF